MLKISRNTVLPTVVVALLLATLPSSIRRILQTVHLYLFGRQFFEDMLARLSGPGRLRFIVQPSVAILLGSRDGVKDARRGVSPFLWALAFHSGHRKQLLQGAFASVGNLVAIAIPLDLLSQFLIFREIHPGAALLLGPVLISTPYAVSRAMTNRITQKSKPAASPTAN